MKIQKLQDRLNRKNKIQLEVTEDAIQAIVARCTEVETGARNIDFILKSVILPLLSDALLTTVSQAGVQTTLTLGLNSDGDFLVGFHSTMS
jgi:type VI secretion system protein VasG